MSKDLIKKGFVVFLPIILLAVSFSAVSTNFVSADEENGNSAFGLSHKPVCPGRSTPDSVNCNALVVVDKDTATARKNNSPVGLTPANLHTAYTSTNTVSGSKIIAIVDAFDNPNIGSELATYSKQFGLPVLPDCVGSISASSVPCFKKINQNGGSLYPSPNPTWALEISLDVEIAHAMCQNCKILLVESDDNGINALMSAVDQAIAQGANVISNSWGLGEFSAQTTFDSHFNHPGIAITFSSGDAGGVVQYPASSPYVVAVGGTTLNLKGSGYGSESAWAGGGSGCSQYEPKPTWQTDSGCANRTTVDVSAVADPNTGAAIYNIYYASKNNPGWYTVGGTSLSSPLIAGIYALGGVPANTQAASISYANFSLANFHDVTTGANAVCSVAYLCNAGSGFDGPTGLGTPKGLGAF